MKDLYDRLNMMMLKAMLGLEEIRDDESGMEVIQMLVLLALGLALIAVFIGFQDTIMARVNELVQSFLDVF